MNRQLTGTMADLHFAPTSKAEENLLNENKKDNIFVTGNTATDALKTTVRSTYSLYPVLNGLGEDRLILLTAHRRENLGEPMRNIFRTVKRIIVEHDDVQVVYPVHLNPLVQELANEVLGDDLRVHFDRTAGCIGFRSNFASQSLSDFD